MKNKTNIVRVKPIKVEISEKTLLTINSRIDNCMDLLQDLITKSHDGTLSPIQFEKSGERIIQLLSTALDPIQDELADAVMRSSNR
jgi:hypothetical protein